MGNESDLSVNNQSVTDLSYLREVVMGDEEIIIKTTKAFLEDTPNVLNNMKEHFSKEEWDKLYKQAHKIKPNMEYMGMKQARELVLEIEEQAKSGDPSDNLGDKIKELNLICVKAHEELSAKIEELKSDKA